MFLSHMPDCYELLLHMSCLASLAVQLIEKKLEDAGAVRGRSK